MRSGIDHAVLRVIVRQIIAVFSRIKRELQHLHAREAGLFHQPDNRRREESQIFRDDGLVSKLFPHLCKKLEAGALSPLSMLCCRIAVRNCVILVKTAEMIDPDNIVQAEAPFESLQPPGKSGLFVVVPLINRISPELSCRGKSVRRAARNNGRISVFIQLEKFRMAPGVRRIKRDIDRNVSDNSDAVFIRVIFQRLPLVPEQVLLELVETDFIRELFLISPERFRFSEPDIIVPLCIRRAVKTVLDGTVQCIIVQPVRVFPRKFFEGSPVRVIVSGCPLSRRHFRERTVLIRLIEQRKTVL